jgi:hypothetical protein
MISRNSVLTYHHLLPHEMNRVKKFLRLLGLVCWIILASMGIGFTISFNSREKYMDYEIKTEQSESKEEESEAELKEKK